MALTAEIPTAGATARGEGRALRLASATSIICARYGLEKKEREANYSSDGERVGGGMERSDFASKDSLLSLSLVDVICSYDHLKPCFFWCLDKQTPGLGAQSGLSFRK